MSASAADLAINVSVDASGVASGMAEVDTAIENTTTVVIKQEESWVSLASKAGHSAAEVSLAGLAIAKFVYGAEKTASVLAAVAGGAAAAAGTLAATGSAALGAMAGIMGMNVAGTGLVGTLGGLVFNHQYLLSILGMVAPAIWPVTAAVGAAITIYKLASIGIRDLTTAYSESVNKTGELIPEYNALDRSITKLKQSASELGSAIATPFRDGFSAVGAYVESFSPLPTLAGLASSAIDYHRQGIQQLTGTLRAATSVAITTAFIASSGASADAAASFHEQGQELARLAEQSDKVIAKQESMRASFQAFRAIQENAQQSAANAAEVGSVSKMTSVAEIDATVNALRERARAAFDAGTADEKWFEHINAMFQALEKQRQAITDGSLAAKEREASEKAVQSSFASVQRSLAELTLGEREASLASFAAVAATDDQVAAYAEYLDKIAAAKAAKEAEKKAEDEVNRARERQKDINKRAADSAAKLADEIAVLNKEMTKEEATKRELMRQGFSEGQAGNQASLEAQKARREKEIEAQKKAANPAAFAAAGSREAYSTIVRALNGGGTPMERNTASMDKTLKSIDKNIKQIGKSGPSTAGPTLKNLGDV